MDRNSNKNKLSKKLDNFFSKTLEKKFDPELSLNSQNKIVNGLLNDTTNEKNFNRLQNFLKIISLISFLPYSILGMFYINNPLIFIPCLILATSTIIFSMLFSIRIQAVQNSVNITMDKYTKSIDKFIVENRDKIEYLKGIEILDHSISRVHSSSKILDANFISNSFGNSSNLNDNNSDKKDIDFANLNISNDQAVDSKVLNSISSN